MLKQNNKRNPRSSKIPSYHLDRKTDAELYPPPRNLLPAAVTATSQGRKKKKVSFNFMTEPAVVKPFGNDTSRALVTSLLCPSACTASGRQEHLDSDASSESIGPVSM